jgi:hypothetical protein
MHANLQKSSSPDSGSPDYLTELIPDFPYTNQAKAHAVGNTPIGPHGDAGSDHNISVVRDASKLLAGSLPIHPLIHKHRVLHLGIREEVSLSGYDQINIYKNLMAACEHPHN